jgi:UDP-N-acetylmuramoyl-L-alanyl-D-glutamate--2,6-diaminopimelate ligase
LRLDRLLDGVEVISVEGDPAADVVDVTYVSTEARPGSLFCCLRGTRADGHDHASDAVARGAVALVVERVLDLPAPVQAQVCVHDARASMAPIAAALHGHPSAALDVVGVTGTNGKSTTAMLVQSILDHAGRPCGLIGTMNSARTTPEAPELQARLAAFVSDGMTAAALEVSSVGLEQRRVDAVRFAVGVFTNLSPDELGIHGSMDSYFAAKARLFEPGRSAVGVVNADDEWGRALLSSARIPMRPFSLADARDLHVSPRSSTFAWRGAPVHLHMGAPFNVMNALAAATATAELGVDVETITGALSSIAALPGHGEDVDAGQPFRVVVDYAHTAGALAAVLDASRATAGGGGRVIVVFGSGGDRDPSRRPLMGEAAGRHADVVVVTSDNPRGEPPAAIVDAIVEGAKPHARDLRVEVDRRVAIELALREARGGDVVVIAGKGHEQGQEVAGEVLPFDDRQVALGVLKTLGYAP